MKQKLKRVLNSKITLFLHVFSFFLIFAHLYADDVYYLKTDNLAIGLSNGQITSLLAFKEGKEYLPAGVPAPILQIRLFQDGGAKKDYAPETMTWTVPGQEFILGYGSTGVTVKVKVVAHPSQEHYHD
jgi:hypothetical protein